jgi:hypothetical protein
MRLVLAVALLFVFPGFLFAGPPFIATSSAPPIDTGAYRLEGISRFSDNTPGAKTSTLSAAFKYGLIHNLEIEAKVPYIFASDQGKTRNQFGDIALKTKVLFLKGREAAPISVAGEIQVKIPSASQNALAKTTGAADIGLALLATKEIFPYRAHVNLSHTYVGNPPNGTSSDRRNYSMAVQYTPSYPNLIFAGELYGSDLAGQGWSNDQWSAAGGASYQVRPDVTVHGMLGLPLSTRAPDYTLNLAVGYRLR